MTTHTRLIGVLGLMPMAYKKIPVIHLGHYEINQAYGLILQLCRVVITMRWGTNVESQDSAIPFVLMG